jgi:hypothetical protein
MDQVQYGDLALAVDRSTGQPTFSKVLFMGAAVKAQPLPYLAVTTASGRVLKLSAPHWLHRARLAMPAAGSVLSQLPFTGPVLFTGLSVSHAFASKSNNVMMPHALQHLPQRWMSAITAGSLAGRQVEQVAAKQLRVGDVVFVAPAAGGSNGTTSLVPEVVTSIDHVQEEGAYAPVTAAGTIMVDGVLASCFAEGSATLPNALQLAAVRLADQLAPGWVGSRLAGLVERGGAMRLPMWERMQLAGEALAAAAWHGLVGSNANAWWGGHKAGSPARTVSPARDAHEMCPAA